MSTACFLNAPNLFFPAIVTPLNQHGDDVDEDSLRRLCQYMYASGVGGLYVLGNTGEGMHLSEAVRKKVAEICVEETNSKSKNHLCIIHVGSAQPTESMRLASHAVAIGASAVSSLPPFISHNSFGYTKEFYKNLAEAASGAPIIAYHIPSVTGINLSVAQLVELLQIPGVVGYKYTDLNLDKMNSLISRCPNAIIFHGVSPMQTAARLYGAPGGITGGSNCMIKPLVAIHELCNKGLYQQAMEQHQKPFNRSNEVLNSNGNKQVQGFKHILCWQNIISHVTCAARDEMTADEVVAFRARCEADALLAPTLVKPVLQ